MQELQAGSGPFTAADAIDALGLEGGGRPGRPRVVAIMVASVDGRATVGNTSGGLGHPEDRELLRGLRAACDCVMAGTGTIAGEKYANLLDADQRAARVAAGRSPHPLVTTVSRSGDFPWEVPVFSEPDVAKQLYADHEVPVPSAATDTCVTVLGGGLDAVFAHLFAEREVRSVACEGGPGLLRALLAEGLVDDLLLTLAPLLVGGDGPTSLTGPALEPPARMNLGDVRRAGDHLFLHYTR